MTFVKDTYNVITVTMMIIVFLWVRPFFFHFSTAITLLYFIRFEKKLRNIKFSINLETFVVASSCKKIIYYPVSFKL